MRKMQQVRPLLLVLVVGLLTSAITESALAQRGGSPPMEFKDAASGGNCLDCVWLQGTGTITAETPKQLREKLRGMTRPIVVLNSPGGDLRAGLSMGMILREARAHTIVGETHGPANSQSIERGICASACAYAFLGGVERTLKPDSRYGVHQFYDSRALLKDGLASYSGSDIQKVQAQVGLLVAYARELSIDPSLIHLASRTAPSDVRWLEQEELDSLKIVTPTQSSGKWEIRPSADGSALIATMPFRYRTNPSQLVSIYCRRDTPNVVIFQIAASIAEQIGRMQIQNAESLAKLISAIEIAEDIGTQSSFRVSRKPARVRLDRDVATVVMAVSLQEAESILRQNKAAISVDLPHVFGELDLYAIMNIDAGRPHIRAALRNCV